VEKLIIKDYSIPKAILFILMGLIGITVGGRLIVFSAVEIAKDLHISERIISLTIISIGTSLPELATSVTAVIKKNTDIAIGNIVGSNIFNVFFVLGAFGNYKSGAVTKKFQSGYYNKYRCKFFTNALCFHRKRQKNRKRRRYNPCYDVRCIHHNLDNEYFLSVINDNIVTVLKGLSLKL